jgi:hypothetical protein
MMKYILTIAMMLIGFSVMAQTPTLDSLGRKARLSDGNMKMTIPGWLMRFGLSFAEVEDEHIAAFSTLKKGLRKAKILVLEDQNVPASTSKRIQSEFRNDGYEEYVSVRNGGTHVNIMVREECNKIRNLAILVNEPTAEFVAVTLKTKLKMEDLEQLIASIE